MVKFFIVPDGTVYAVDAISALTSEDLNKFKWLFNDAKAQSRQTLPGFYIGPRKEMVTPWSTNAVEITQNMGINGIIRIEEFRLVDSESAPYDKMLQRLYNGLNQHIFKITKEAEPILYIDSIEQYNQQEGLALSDQEIEYLNSLSHKLGRRLTDSEVFGFSQVNSEHCRHKIFNGRFIIDGIEKEQSLFQLIKETSKANPNRLISAYKDNVAFNQGPTIQQFAPATGDLPDFFTIKNIESVLSLKAETHNFPTTVEPFNGAATGTGGEIRDRLGGGKASLPLAGTAVYMTAYPRTEEGREWEEGTMAARKWLYQTPEQILIKASNGASDFGNKFGQPLICGSLFTFEHEECNQKLAFDKVIMLAGGVGFGTKRDALKGTPEIGDKVVVMGGDNYRIGMGGGAVSSVNTGLYKNAIELNAVQRANPEMQKRVSNVIRTIAEADQNPIVSIHDHGAGGHLNALSELIESTGGVIHVDKLPIGDPTLSAKEIVGNESQERMGLLIKEQDIALIERIAQRERAPLYVVGETTGDHRFVFDQPDGSKPIDLEMKDMFGNPPATYMTDSTVQHHYEAPIYNAAQLDEYIERVLQLEAVACKDWLTNKVDRSVTGRIARQQCQGEIQLPLSDCGVVALDYLGTKGMATSIGHAPAAAIADAARGSILAIAESLTNIVWAPLTEGLKSISLSANWMWPCRNKGEDARLYEAVQAAGEFATALGVNIPTGKDSLSMTQKYGDEKVLSPGTVIISAAGEVSDIKQVVSPVLQKNSRSALYYIDFSFEPLALGGSAFAQSLNKIGNSVPTVADSDYFIRAFESIQELIRGGYVLAGHDISAGGMITSALEMCFANMEGGLELSLDTIKEDDLIKILFSENPGVLIQVADRKAVEGILNKYEVAFAKIGKMSSERHILVTHQGVQYQFAIDHLRDVWYSSSYLLDRKQSGEKYARARFENYKQQPLQYKFPKSFEGTRAALQLNPLRTEPSGIKAAIIREKGVNGDREMAYSLYLAGFDVKDVHITDLISGRETLEDISMIVYCGGFSNSDVLGSAKGWAGGFLFNEKAKRSLDNFYARENTLSLGICNGCQLMVELGLLYPSHKKRVRMEHNDSHKFESNFVGLSITKNNSVMFGSLSGSKLGVWVAHGEGKFNLPYSKSQYNIIAQYSYDSYPANPNGSPMAVAGLCSKDGRHLAMMPHLERAIFPWQWAHYPVSGANNEITPWLEAFVNAKKWIENRLSHQ